jgi:CRP-like cAMP-binding protein
MMRVDDLVADIEGHHQRLRTPPDTHKRVFLTYIDAAMAASELLSNVALFSELLPEELEKISTAAQQRALRRGDVLFSEGDEPDDLFVVVSGRIAMSNKSVDGRESVVALMEAGDVFGEMPLFDGLGRSTEARALEPSEVVAIPYAPIQEVYESRPTLLWSVVAMLSGRIRAMDAALADSVFLDVTGRTAKRLLELAGSSDEFTMPVTQEELAGMVGASRERVNKAIAAFVKLEWIEQSERRYRITNRQQLELRSR